MKFHQDDIRIQIKCLLTEIKSLFGKEEKTTLSHFQVMKADYFSSLMADICWRSFNDYGQKDIFINAITSRAISSAT